MNCFYHNGGFLLDGLHTIPAEAVPITEMEHANLLQAQSEGGSIQSDETGKPVVVWPEGLLTPDPVETRLAELADIRWQHQNAGVTINGVRLRTDRESILDLRFIAERSAAKFPLSYKAASEFVTLESKEQAEQYANAQNDHVQACFDREAALSERIADQKNDLAALAELNLEQGWPE